MNDTFPEHGTAEQDVVFVAFRRPLGLSHTSHDYIYWCMAQPKGPAARLVPAGPRRPPALSPAFKAGRPAQRAAVALGFGPPVQGGPSPLNAGLTFTFYLRRY